MEIREVEKTIRDRAGSGFTGKVVVRYIEAALARAGPKRAKAAAAGAPAGRPVILRLDGRDFPLAADDAVADSPTR